MNARLLAEHITYIPITLTMMPVKYYNHPSNDKKPQAPGGNRIIQGHLTGILT